MSLCISFYLHKFCLPLFGFFRFVPGFVEGDYQPDQRLQDHIGLYIDGAEVAIDVDPNDYSISSPRRDTSSCCALPADQDPT
jgi:hypothetical protein